MVNYLTALPPSAYHDPREVICKHIIAQTYWSILDKIKKEKVDESKYEHLRIAFVRFFNSQYLLDGLFRHSNAAARQLILQLNKTGHTQLAKEIKAESDSTKSHLKTLMSLLSSLRHVEKSQGYVVDGVIEIAGKSMIDYASNPGYINACLELIGEDSEEVYNLARNAWNKGFTVDKKLLSEVKAQLLFKASAIDVVTRVLLQEEQTGAYPSLQDYEYFTQLSEEENRIRRHDAIAEGYFLLGRAMAVFSLMTETSYPLSPDEIKKLCPIHAFIKQSGINLKHHQVEVIKQIMLVRSTHGLSPGEFAARIASSVRASFPKSLIAGLIVRTGKTHGGAVAHSMNQQLLYLESHSKSLFVTSLLETGSLSGFGHRIHKVKKAGTDKLAGADPRVGYMFERIREAFPEKKHLIDELEQFAIRIQIIKPSLSPNTDFVAGILFHCLGISSETGSAFFIVTRLPGLISEIINQLDYKANSLRPPLAVTLPYRL